MLGQNDGAPVYLESMEKFGRVTAYSKAAEDNQTRVFVSDNVGRLKRWARVHKMYLT
jgi:hypothetical protein